MATVPETSIADMNRQSARIEAETRKLMAEANKLAAEQQKPATGRGILCRSLVVQSMLATVALLGAGAATAKLLFS